VRKSHRGGGPAFPFPVATASLTGIEEHGIRTRPVRCYGSGPSKLNPSIRGSRRIFFLHLACRGRTTRYPQLSLELLVTSSRGYDGPSALTSRCASGRPTASALIGAKDNHRNAHTYPVSISELSSREPGTPKVPKYKSRSRGFAGFTRPANPGRPSAGFSIIGKLRRIPSTGAHRDGDPLGGFWALLTAGVLFHSFELGLAQCARERKLVQVLPECRRAVPLVCYLIPRAGSPAKLNAPFSDSSPHPAENA